MHTYIHIHTYIHTYIHAYTYRHIHKTQDELCIQRSALTQSESGCIHIYTHIHTYIHETQDEIRIQTSVLTLPESESELVRDKKHTGSVQTQESTQACDTIATQEGAHYATQKDKKKSAPYGTSIHENMLQGTPTMHDSLTQAGQTDNKPSDRSTSELSNASTTSATAGATTNGTATATPNTRARETTNWSNPATSHYVATSPSSTHTKPSPGVNKPSLTSLTAPPEVPQGQISSGQNTASPTEFGDNLSQNVVPPRERKKLATLKSLPPIRAARMVQE
jgi:hypothetical protein